MATATKTTTAKSTKAAPVKSAAKSAETPAPKTTARRAPAKTTAKSAAKAPSVRKAPAKAAAKALAKPAKAPKADRAWQLAKQIGICHFITWDGERQRARPLHAKVKKDEHAIWFLIDVDGAKDDQIEKFPIVSLAFADNAHARYVSITGKASVVNDRAKIKQLWSPFAQAWWDSPDDPGIRVIRVDPQDAEIWDSPGRIAATVAMLAAVVTRKEPKLVENAKVAL